jgi:hypothetical protein
MKSPSTGELKPVGSVRAGVIIRRLNLAGITHQLTGNGIGFVAVGFHQFIGFDERRAALIG